MSRAIREARSLNVLHLGSVSEVTATMIALEEKISINWMVVVASKAEAREIESKRK